MKNTSVIAAIDGNTLFNDRILVDFVTQKLSYIASPEDDALPVNFSTLVWASTAIPVKGNLEIIFASNDYQYIERVDTPVDSLFFITCAKDETGTCRVAWSCSLS
jgi:hypothetical protein